MKKRHAAISAALLGVWFFLVYGLCNWITSQRDDVGTWFFAWEKHIPFIPEFVIPYYSMDLLFVGGFFLCKTRAEMSVLCKRVFWLILASGCGFLIFPLELGMERPVPECGWTVPWFKLLHAQDLPYNLAPSLHISLRTTFWLTYGRHLRGWLRKVAKIWFIMIGASTLLIWQHHVMDVVTGFLMAWVILALIPDRETQSIPEGWFGYRTRKHCTLSLRYGTGALICILMALLGGEYLWFLWPAMGLGVMTLSYATANP